MAAIDRRPTGIAQLGALFMRGVVDPKPHVLMLRIGVDPELVARVGDEIMERSWPKAAI